MAFRNDRFAVIALVWVVSILTPARADDPQTPSRETTPRRDAPTYIFLNAPGDLNALLAKLSRPDLVLVDWERYQALVDAASRDNAPQRPRDPSVQALEIKGALGDEAADLVLSLEIAGIEEGPTRIPLPLDDVVILDVTEAEGHRLGLERQGGGWELVLTGSGVHRVEIQIRVPVRAQGPRRRLELAIPEASSNRLDLAGPEGMTDPRIEGEGLGVSLSAEPVARRVIARFAPRGHLDLTWKQASAGQSAAPVLTAQGEIVLEAEGGVLRAEGTFELRATQAPLDFVTIRVGPGWQEMAVLIDGVETPAATSTDEQGSRLLKVAAHVVPDKPVRLGLRARRSFVMDEEQSYTGFVIEEAQTQSGLIVLAHGPELGVIAQARRGVRPLERRSDLPMSLRMRPNADLGLRFFEQPLELMLRFVAAIAWQHVETLDIVSIEPNRTVLDCWMTFHRRPRSGTRLALRVPRELTIDEVGPASVVTGFELLASDVAGESILVALLDERADEASTFALHVTGSVAATINGKRKLPAAQPDLKITSSRWLALTASPNVAFQVEPNGATPLDRTQVYMAAWPEAATTALSGRDMRWFRPVNPAAAVEIQTQARERQLITRNEVTLRVGRQAVAFEQSFELQCRDGAVDSLEFDIPRELSGAWRLDGLDVARREVVERLGGGGERVRTTLPRALTGTVRFSLVCQFPLPLDDTAPNARLRVPIVSLVGAQVEAARVEAFPQGGIELVGGSGWTAASSSQGASWVAKSANPESLPAELGVRVPPMARMAEVSIPRCYVHTTIMDDRRCRVTLALRVERHGPTLTLDLPDEATLITASWSGRPIEGVSRDTASRLRLPLPADENSGVLSLSYSTRTRADSGGWAPASLEGAALGSIYWSIGIPSSSVILGTPAGWSDANDWGWSALVYERRGAKWGNDLLLRWLQGEDASEATRPVDVARDLGLDRELLFTRSGSLAVPSLWVVPRAWLIGATSFIVVVALIVWQRSSARLRRWIAILTAVATAGLALLIPTTSLQLIGASLPGLGLAAIVIAVGPIARRVQKPRPHVTKTVGSTIDSQLRRANAGSQVEEGSTLVRPRGAPAAEPATSGSSQTPSASNTTG